MPMTRKTRKRLWQWIGISVNNLWGCGFRRHILQKTIPGGCTGEIHYCSLYVISRIVTDSNTPSLYDIFFVQFLFLS